MALPLSLDLDLLRSFVAIAEEKSFTKAAERVGRTQSAVSLQMQRLEGMLGKPVLLRGKGGIVELNGDGVYFLTRAREILAMNDDIMGSMVRRPEHKAVRIGIADDVPGPILSQAIGLYMEQSPGTEVQSTVSQSCVLSAQLREGQIDIAVIRNGMDPPGWPSVELDRKPLQWVTSTEHQQHLRTPLPLVLAPSECPWVPPWLTECPWNTMATRALTVAARAYRVVSRSNTTSGMFAAAQAGLGVTMVLNSEVLPAGLRSVGPEEGLPKLPDLSWLLVKAPQPRQPATDMLADVIQSLFKVS